MKNNLLIKGVLALFMLVLSAGCMGAAGNCCFRYHHQRRRQFPVADGHGAGERHKPGYRK